MTLDRNNIFHNAKVYSFLKRASIKEDNRYFLGILNSKIMWFFLKRTGYVLRGGYFTFKTEYLKPFHIPRPPSKQIETIFIEKVNTILDLNKEFYFHHTKFQNRITGYFGKIKVSKSLEMFYELSFDSFVSQINKVTNIKMSLKQQDEWEDYFCLYKKNILKLKSEIDKIDSELNKMVFDLYELNENERQIVEKN
jgi:hypothetical protein